MVIWTEENARMLEPAFAELRRAEALEAGVRWSRRQGAARAASWLSWDAAAHRARAGRMLRRLSTTRRPSRRCAPRAPSRPPTPRAVARRGEAPPGDDDPPPPDDDQRHRGCPNCGSARHWTWPRRGPLPHECQEELAGAVIARIATRGTRA